MYAFKVLAKEIARMEERITKVMETVHLIISRSKDLEGDELEELKKSLKELVEFERYISEIKRFIKELHE